jgi:hypothetical protein
MAVRASAPAAVVAASVVSSRVRVIGVPSSRSSRRPVSAWAMAAIRVAVKPPSGTASSANRVAA